MNPAQEGLNITNNTLINMSSYRQILYHIIFRTKEGKNTLSLKNIDELYKYIWGIIKRKTAYYIE